MIRSDAQFRDLDWQKATVSGEAGCVIVASCDGAVALSDSKTLDAPVLLYTVAEWTAFLSGARSGEFDRFAVH